jgi:hypothetical protein
LSSIFKACFDHLNSVVMKLLKLLLPVAGLLVAGPIFAQNKMPVDTIRVDAKRLLMSQVREGTYQYLVSFHGTDLNQVKSASIWTRKVKFEKWQGQDVISIRQEWSSQDTILNRSIWSVSEKATFKPLYHCAKSSRTGIEAFQFEKNRVAGVDSVTNNKRKGWSIDLKAPTFNWELDLEILALLPYKDNTGYAVNFYHPGAKSAPAYYLYQVVGSEMLDLVQGQKVDCWKVRIDYDPKYYAVFWVSKKTREVLKAADVLPNGYRFKVRLAGEIKM